MQLIGAVISDELRDMNIDLDLQEQIVAELSEDAYAWHLDDISQFDEQAALNGADGSDSCDTSSESPPFFCPICQTSVLQPVFDHYACESCALRFKSSATPHLQMALLQKLTEHERMPPNGCDVMVTFFAEPVPGSQFASLNVVCPVCDFYATFRP